MATRRKSLVKLFSRSNIEGSSLASNDVSTSVTLAASAPQDNRGKLGLTTVYTPASSSPIAELVFIHGLGGNSRKTWSFTTDPRQFWPQAWLPSDPDFTETRIHVFGYNADWRDRQYSPLSIHDFAQSLIGELKNDPDIRRAASPIIFVCHSMGGCVAKKAYILARIDPTCKDLAQRVHSMFFLGTPHRGADLAPILKSILTLAWGKKPFFEGLLLGSDTLAETNDAFRHYALDLGLWSFYETRPVKTKLLDKMIVEKASATLGYPNEEIAAMNADHRHMCKFENTGDPNYRLLRNALNTAIDSIRESKDKPSSRPRLVPGQLKLPRGETLNNEIARLLERLGVTKDSNDDFAELQLLKQPGSCLWFTEGGLFNAWKDGESPHILWLFGRPAAGKSVLACHVIEYLTHPAKKCSHFFFKYGEHGRSTLSDCLLSLACQMAMKDTSIRQDVLSMLEDQTAWDKTKETVLWRRLFLDVIFKSPSISQHCWVIDGVDECSNFNSLFNKRLIATIPHEVKVFATSRDLEEIERGLRTLGGKVTCRSISETDTLDDMRLFLNTKLGELDRFEDENERKDMYERILKKSQGSFLWVRLVLQDFENAWTKEAMETALKEVPPDLHTIYLRILHNIKRNARNMKLAKAILSWVTYAFRPLSIHELRCAIKLDIDESLQDLGKSIPSICGQLAFVDQNGKIQIIHETAHRFLLEHSSELIATGSQAHSRISTLLLDYLSSEVLQAQANKSQKSRPKVFSISKPSAATSLDLDLLSYSGQSFSDHVHCSVSEDDSVLEYLYKFLESRNVFYWIEYHAVRGELGNITQTAMNLHHYLVKKRAYAPLTDSQVKIVGNWVIDLIRVAAKFRLQLLSCPSSIHCLVPPLCPTNSNIFKASMRNPRNSSLVVKNLAHEDWDDCLARIDFDKGESTALAHGTTFFAVGQSNGIVTLYESSSLQRVQVVTHPERIRLLQFSQDDELFATCGTKQILVWVAQTGTCLGSSAFTSVPLAITFLGSVELLIASQESELKKWNLETGALESISWLMTKVDENGGPVGSPQPPSRVAFSALTPENDLLMAVGYRSHPISLSLPLELHQLGELGPCRANGVLEMAFHPNSDIPAVIVSYAQGDLCAYNYMTMQQDYKQTKVHAVSLCCSQDGQTLVTGSSQGVIQVFEFDLGCTGEIVLTLLCRFKAFESGVRGVALNFDGLRLVGIGRRQCHVWEPAALARKDNELESISETVPIAQGGPSATTQQTKPQITTPLVMLVGEGLILAGKSDGSISAFSLNDGTEIGVSHRHNRGISVNRLIIAEKSRLVVSADISGRIIIARITLKNLETAPSKTFPTTERLATVIHDQSFKAAVVGLMVNHNANRLLVSGHEFDELWDMNSGQVVERHMNIQGKDETFSAAANNQPGTLMPRATLQHPTNSDLFIAIKGGIARIFQWSNYKELTPEGGIELAPPVSCHDITNGILGSYTITSELVIEHRAPSHSHEGSLRLWPVSKFDVGSGSSECSSNNMQMDAIQSSVLAVIGMSKDSRLMFLDSDFWVCSVELRDSASSALRVGNLSNGLQQSRRPSSNVSSPSPLTRGPNHGKIAATTTKVAHGQGHIRRHFFALSEWRDGTNKFRCVMLPSKTMGASRNRGLDFAFVSGDRVIVVQAGTEFSEVVTVGARTPTETQSLKVGSTSPTRSRFNGQWNVVSGSMHRRSSAW
ncbi:Vegetative incompatibility protein [Paramyrothecium foliicola]|nr:Vegetative incompatibility protein [Paramyrothecium foliicola]